jgi:hypothetical protein
VLFSLSLSHFCTFSRTKLNYGVGYYSPVDCDHIDILCEYNKYPEFDLLAAKLFSVNNTWVPGKTNEPVSNASFASSLPICPIGIAPIGDFQWAADDEPDLPCYTLPPAEAPGVSKGLSLYPIMPSIIISIGLVIFHWINNV